MEPRLVKPLRIGNYDRNFANELARGSNRSPCTKYTAASARQRALSVASALSSKRNRAHANRGGRFKSPGHAFEPKPCQFNGVRANATEVPGSLHARCVNFVAILSAADARVHLVSSGISHLPDENPSGR